MADGSTQSNVADAKSVVKPVEKLTKEKLEAGIRQLCGYTPEEAELVKKNAKMSKLKLEHCKQMAASLGLMISASKGDLIDSIRAKVNKTAELESILVQDNGGSNFRKDKNTFPRYCNIIMQYPDQLQQTQSLPTRTDLQNRQINEAQPVFVTACEHFNNAEYDCGGLVRPHEQYRDARIDPRDTSNCGNMTPDIGYKLWKKVLAKYQSVILNFENSGRHNNHDFWTYCYDIDVMYLFHSIEKAASKELTTFCMEGNVLKKGLDTSAALLNKTGTTDDADEQKHSNKKKRSSKDKAFTDIADSMKKKADLAEGLAKSACLLNESEALRNKEQTIATLAAHITSSQASIAEMEKSPAYKPNTPSDQLVFLRRNVARSIATYNKLTADDGVDL